MKLVLKFTALFVLILNSAFAQIKTLGETVNSARNEIRPVVSKDGKKMFYTVEGSVGFKNKDNQEIWMAEKNSIGEWSNPRRLPDLINCQKYNSVYWTSEIGDIILIRGRYDEKEKRIYRGFSLAKNIGGEWMKPEPVQIKDYDLLSRGIYTGATMTEDRKALVLYFTEETNGETNDLWVSLWEDSSGSYGTPFKLNISKESDDEISPYISSDGKTLYFSSDAEGGFGSHDIWMTRRMDSTWKNWSVPVNIGFPFNSDKWDAYFSIGDQDTVGYFSSNKKHSIPSKMGGSDLFCAVIPEFYRPEKPTPPVHDTLVLSIISHDTIIQTKYIPCNPLDTMDESDLKKLLVRGRIMFDYGSSMLRGEAFKKLDVIIALMRKNPNLVVEISGHSDSLGTSKGNQKQSVERAESAKAYLLSKDIEAKRIELKGHGSRKPVASNKTDEGRQLNRRVEITIIKE